ncbi:uncharacterized protein BDV17DRAFT_249176 [Aspergillus undulatus]|uniref:uncharacterized protein n=1 Tax=Aspergillus undulatus TaxID=1810928 RepID=UPI003CCCC974
MDSPSSIRSSPTKALNPLSPERMNRENIPNSPSSVSDALRLQCKNNRGLSDVQSRVAYLNTLSPGGSPTRPAMGSSSAGGTAALQRAILGREEAESALSRATEQLSEAQSRERRISERLESLLEELQAAKERQAHERVIFEKEIRKARKEAFRAGSTLVKTQEELKHVRAEAKSLSQEVQSERDSKEKAKQEAFERAYAIAGLTEELEEVKGRLRTVEATNHAITLQHARAREIKKQGISRMSIAEGDLALIMTPSPRKPKRPAEDDVPVMEKGGATPRESTPPKKAMRLSEPLPIKYTEHFEDERPLTVQELLDRLVEELEDEKKLRADAEDLIEFMQVQCMFRVCGCRQLERKENEARAKKQAIAAQEQETHEQLEEHECHIPEAQDGTHQQAEEDSPQTEAIEEETRPEEIQAQIEDEVKMEDIQGEGFQEEEPQEDDTQEEAHAEIQEEIGEPLITFSPVTGTFRTIPSPVRSPPQKQAQDATLHNSEPSPTRSRSRPEASSASVASVPKYDSHPNEVLSQSIPQGEAYSRDLTPGAHDDPMTAEAQWQSKYERWTSAENVNEIHNVKRIPLRNEEETSSQFVAAPGTPISREEALAQIRARRGRTNAMNRSVSASDAGFRAGGLNVTPARVARRIPGVQHSDPRGEGVRKSRRDMSAPMRIFR